MIMEMRTIMAMIIVSVTVMVFFKTAMKPLLMTTTATTTMTKKTMITKTRTTETMTTTMVS